MKPYSEYKDSRIVWVGDIPAQWSIRRLKYLVSTTTGERDTVDNVDEGEYPFFVRSQTVERINSYSYDGEAVLTAGAGVGVAKVFHYVNGKFDFHQRVYKFSGFKDILGKFFFYYISNNLKHEVLKLSAKSTVDSLRMPMLQNFFITLPSLEEQITIVDFLDCKTAQIDTLIKKKHRQIDLLQEQRTALINQAVTKGLNPDAPMKDSGVEWLGEIPGHWKASKPKYFCSHIVDGTHVTPEYVDEGIPFITVQNLTEFDGISFEKTKYIRQTDHEKLCFRCKPERGDLLITKDGTLGIPRVIETDREFSIFVSVALLKPIRSLVDPYYLRYALESSFVVEQFESRKRGSALRHLHLVEISNITVLLPPIEEQIQ